MSMIPSPLDERDLNDPVRVLLLDSDPRSIETASTVFEEEFGIDVTAVGDETAAFEVLATEPIDCVVSELRLPETDGIELLRSIRTAAVDVPLVVFATSDDDAAVDDALEAGATDYLEKRHDGSQYRWLASRVAAAVTAPREFATARFGPAVEGSCLLDDEQTFVGVSGVFAKMYGYRPAELVGEPWSVIAATDETGGGFDALDELDRYEAAVDRTVGVRKDGETVPIRRTVVRISDDKYACTTTEVTVDGEPAAESSDGSRQAEAIRRLTSLLDRERSLETVLEAGTRELRAAIGVAFVGVFERRRDGSEFVLSAGSDPQGDVAKQLSALPADSHLGYALERDEPVALDANDPRFAEIGVPLSAYGIGSVAATVVDSSRRTPRVLAAYATDSGAFGPAEIDALRSVAELFGLAVAFERHERRADAVVELATEIGTADTACEVRTAVVDALEAVQRAAAIYAYDDRRDALERLTETDRFEGGDAELRFDDADPDAAWQALIEGGPVLARELVPRPVALDDRDSPPRGIAIPVGTDEVLVAGSVDGSAPSDADFGVARLAAALARTAFERLDRDRQLDACESDLESATHAVERLTELTDLVRDVGRILGEARGRGDLERRLCDRLLAHEPYAFVWIGEYDEVSGAVRERTTAGAEKSYLNTLEADLSARVDADEPMATTIDRAEARTVRRLIDVMPPTAWQREALERGFRSVVAVPIVFRNLQYGALAAYGDRSLTDAELESELTEELGCWIGQAIHALEIRDALLGGTVVELEFQVADRGIEFVEWVGEVGCTFEFEAVFTRPDGSVRGFFTTTDVDAETVLEWTSHSPAVREARLVTERADHRLFECQFTDESVVAHLLEYGVVPQTMTASEGSGRLTVTVPETVNTREFVSIFKQLYPGSELVRRQDRERTTQTRYGFVAELETELTDRQLEALRTAHVTGYFDVPRNASGKDVAELLGISQPTFNQHLRTAQRKLFAMLFAEEFHER